MFGETIFINIINFFLVVFFMWLSRTWKKTYLVALAYSGAIAILILLIIPSAFPFAVLGFVANFVLSYLVLKVMQKLEETWLHTLVAIIGGLIMMYVAFLPVAYIQSQIISNLLQQ